MTEKWFGDYLEADQRSVFRNVQCGEQVYRELAEIVEPVDVHSAVEYFGGMGFQSAIIQKHFAPQSHTVFEISEEAVAYLQGEAEQNGEEIDVVLGDAYDRDQALRADLVGLDYGDSTVWRMRAGEKQRELLDRVVSLSPRAFVMTDIAGPRLHLQRERYETVLGSGSCSSLEVYLSSLTDFVSAETGYSFDMCVYTRWSAVMSFVSPEYAARARGVIRPLGP